MPVTACPHLDADNTKRVCRHLLETRDADYCKRFTGRGIEYELVCLKCRQNPEQIEANLLWVCFRCFREIEEEGWWEGVMGQPQILERPASLHFDHEAIVLTGAGIETILDIQAVDAAPQSLWVALTTSGQLLAIDLTKRAVSLLSSLPESSLDLERPVSLHVARSGHMAAVVNTKGQGGVVVDLRSGSMTMPLQRDKYLIEHSSFPVAFFELDGRLLLVHATAWNRLDVSDPVTGQLLTGRSPTAYRRGETRPEYYLDYFHCGLTVSPGQDWLADNGWVWHPFGVVTSWNLRHWIQSNVWESEDGPSKRRLCQRAYYWDGPLCWIDDRTLALWGYGTDDEWLVPAAWLFDVESGRELGWFAGPIGRLVFDAYLFSFSEGHGTAVWDATTGERLLNDPAFRPTRYHRGTRHFLTLLPDGAFRLSRLHDDSPSA